MFRLIKVAGWSDGPARCNVIFIHGLGGHAYSTWTRGGDVANFWPLWLASDIQGVETHTLQYPAAPSSWLGASLSIYDRAQTVLEEILAEPALHKCPLVFIAHSMGGLIVKELLREADRRAANGDSSAKRTISQVKAVIFIATPHLGSYQATMLRRISFFVWPSEATQDLTANSSNLRQLHQWYVDWPPAKKIRHLEFQETRDTFGFSIVTRAVPGLNTNPIPIDENHINASKPPTRDNPPYKRTRQLLEELLNSEGKPSYSRTVRFKQEKLSAVRADQAFNGRRAASILAVTALAMSLSYETLRSGMERIAASLLRTKCFVYNPETSLPDKSMGVRDCRKGGIVYVKWVDEAEYPGVDRETNRLPNDRANRALSFEKIDSGGNAVWTESNLVRVLEGRSYWTGSKGGWLEVGKVDVGGRQGMLLRRGFVGEKVECLRPGESNRCGAGPGDLCLLETLIPTDVDKLVNDKNNPSMCYRWTSFKCDGSFPVKIGGKSSGPFDVCVGAIVDAARGR